MAKITPKPTAKTRSSQVDRVLVRELAGLLEETGLSEIEYGRDGWHIRVARGGVATAAAVMAPTDMAPTETTEPIEKKAVNETIDASHPGVMTSPMVGVVYTAPEDGATLFIKVGDQVSTGQTLLLIEAMKVFNPIIAPRDGRIGRILVNNGTPVEYGEPLLIIE
jgi:acetyl-CoA carboxylase biotin carboxyl carrier protein